MTKQFWLEWLGVEPIAMKSGDPRVLCRGEPFDVDYRVVAEKTWQSLLEEYWVCRKERDKLRSKVYIAKGVLDD